MLRIPGLKIYENKVEKRIGVRFGSWNVGSISGRRTEVCEELRKRQVDVCCQQGVRRRGEGAHFFGVKGKRYKLWWCGNDDKTGGVGILVKEELCENVVEIRRRCDRVMAIGLVFEEEVVRVICAYGSQRRKPDARRRHFMRKWRVSGIWQTQMNWCWDWEISIAMLENERKDLKVCMEGIEKKNAEGRMLLDFCDQKELCVANTWYKKKDKRKVTYSLGGNDTEVDFVLVGNIRESTHVM